LNWRHGGMQRSKLGGIPTWGHSELGAQSGRKNQPACCVVSLLAPKLYLQIILLKTDQNQATVKTVQRRS